MSDESRVFWHNAEAEAKPPLDENTVLGVSPQESDSAPDRPSVRDRFVAHYGAIKDWLDNHADHAGVALIVLGEDAMRAAAFVAMKPDSVSTAVIGRHSKADLRLMGDPALSLRHTALLLFPKTAVGRGCRFRLLDLRSATAFVDERGKRLRALEADGPAFVHIGRYVLLVLVLGEDDEAWPSEPTAAWKSIPDRLYLDEVETEERSSEWDADSDRAWEAPDLPSLSEPATLLHSVAGPEMPVHALVESGEPAVGELLVASRRGAATVVVGRRAVESGILLGRSRRCDAGRVLAERTISRVHLLIIEIAGALYAIDTASSNGTFAREDRERATPLEPGVPVSLGEVASVEWRPRGASLA